MLYTLMINKFIKQWARLSREMMRKERKADMWAREVKVKGRREEGERSNSNVGM